MNTKISWGTALWNLPRALLTLLACYFAIILLLISMVAVFCNLFFLSNLLCWTAEKLHKLAHEEAKSLPGYKEHSHDTDL